MKTGVTGSKRAGEALGESLRDFDRAQAVARTGSWRIDIRRNEAACSAEIFRIFGLPPDAPLSYEAFLAAVHPGDRERVDGAWKAALAGAPYDLEFRIAAGGDIKWVRARAEQEYDAEGALTGFFGTTQDITDKKEAEAALRESEERLRLANEAAGIGTFTVDVETGCAHYSPELATMLGFPGIRTATIEDAFARVHRDDVASARAEFAAGLSGAEGGQIRMGDFRFVRPGGEVRWMAWAGRVQFRDGPSGRIPSRIFGACVDITERKRAEAALRESEERYRGIFKHAGTGIAIADLKGRFQSCNPAFSAMLGYATEELCELSFLDVLHPGDHGRNLRELGRLLAREIASFETLNRCVGKRGEPLWGHKHVSLLTDAADRPTGIIVLVTDMSQHKRHEEQIRLLLREVNHRSKNMLALVQAVARQTLAAKPEDFLDLFVERMQALAASQDLLVKSEWKGVDLRELARSQLAHFEDLIGTRIELKGPSLLISASAAQTIGMALHELATNAGKYGALANGDGVVKVAWDFEGAGAGEETFVMSWREQGGPPVTRPVQSGFGSAVVCSLAEQSLNAEVDLDFAVTGLTWRLRCRAEEVLEGNRSAPAARRAKAADPGGHGP